MLFSLAELRILRGTFIVRGFLAGKYVAVTCVLAVLSSLAESRTTLRGTFIVTSEDILVCHDQLACKFHAHASTS